MITKKQYTELSKYERNLKLAYNSNCYTGMYSSELVILTELYNDIFNDEKKMTACSQCILNMLKRLATEYFKFEEKENNKETKTKRNAKKTTKKNI